MNCKGKNLNLKPLFFFLALVISTSLFSVGVARNILQPGRIKGEWRLGIYLPLEVGYKLWLPSLVFFLLALFVLFLLKRVLSSDVNTFRSLMYLVCLALLSFLVQVSISILGKQGFDELALAVINPIYTGYFTDALRVTNVASFLREFPSLMSELACHSETHPPGPILFFWLIIRAMRSSPYLSKMVIGLGHLLRIDFSHLRSFPYSPAEQYQLAASVFSGLFIPFLAAFTIVPIYYLGKDHYGREVGFYAAILYLVAPSVLLYAPKMDQVFALVGACAVVTFYAGFKRKNSWFVLLSSILFSVGIFMSLGLLALLCVFACLALGLCFKGGCLSLRNLEGEGIPLRQNFLIRASSLFLLATLVFYILGYFLFGFNIIEVLRETLKHQEVFNQSRIYSTWVIRNLYDFFAFLGLPICFLLVRKLILQFKEVKEGGIRRLDAMFFAFVLTLVMLDVLGVTRGEVARMWMFLVPLAVLVGASELKDLDILRGRVFFSRSFSLMLLLFLQFFQVVTHKAFINLY